MAKPMPILLILVSILLIVLIFRTERATAPRPISERRETGRVAAKDAFSQTNGADRQLKRPSRPQAPSPSEEEQELSSLEGSVTEEDGSPVADAVVTIYSETTDIKRTATTSSDGSYLVPDLPPGDYGISCASEGYMGGEEEESISVVAGKRARHDFRLTPNLVVQGSVKDRDGNPVADAEVEIQSSPPVWLESAKTDQEGCYEILTVGTYHSFTVSKLGYVVERRWTEGKPKQVDFVLNRMRHRPVEVFGTVKDIEGKPLPNIPIYLSLTWDYGDFNGAVGVEDFLSMPDGSPECSIMVESDLTGNYRIQTTFCGEADRLFLLAEDYRQETILTNGENRIRRDIVLPRKLRGITTVRGKVIDGVTKLPLEGVEIDGIVSGAYGEFTLSVEGPKRNKWISLQKAGYSSCQSVPFLHDPDHPREIDLGNIPLYPPAKVICSIRDETGLSVQPEFTINFPEGRWMTPESISYEGVVASLEVRTFPSESVQATIIIRSRYHEPHEEIVLLRAGAVTRLEIVMKSRQMNSYTIMVTERGGNPIAGAVVGFEEGRAVTNLSGKVSISAYEGEDCVVSARGYSEERLILSDANNVVSVVLSPTRSISGRVVTEDGTIVAGAFIHCKPSGAKDGFILSPSVEAEGSTDAQGRFEIKELRSDNSYDLYATHPYRQLRSDTMTGVAPDAKDIALVAKRNLSGDLTIHFIGEEPPEGEWCVITMFDADLPVQTPQQRFDFVKNRQIKGEDIRTGLYSIELQGDHFSSKTITDVRISPHASAVLFIEVERGIALAGHLVDREGKPVIGKTVYAVDGQGNIVSPFDITSFDGSFRIERASPSTTKIYIQRSVEDDPREIDISGRDLAHLILIDE